MHNSDRSVSVANDHAAILSATAPGTRSGNSRKLEDDGSDVVHPLTQDRGVLSFLDACGFSSPSRRWERCDKTDVCGVWIKMLS
jgi:hypothetical protein